MKVIGYDSIEKKNEVEAAKACPLSSSERLIYVLDLMDFLASIRSSSPRNCKEDEEIDWIILKFKDDNKSPLGNSGVPRNCN